MYLEGRIGETDLLAWRAEGEGRIAEIRSRLAGLGRVSVLAPFAFATSVQAEWDAIDNARRRVVIDTLMTITLHPPGPGRRFNPERVLSIHWKHDAG
jgi:hypothetical protein